MRGANDPFTPLVLESPDGSPGYSNAKLVANHTSWLRGTVRPPNDLKQTWIDFINGAKKELVLNIFDFDLHDVADALVARHLAGVSVRVGIDQGVIKSRPAVKAIFEKLARHGIVTAVDSVGLNHQKVAARDWSLPEAHVLFSSGNLTQSCVGKEGDLKGRKILKGAEYSIPNANNILTLKSRLLALLVQHELTKTLDLKLRGTHYPQSGLYQVQGDIRGTFLIIGFSPRGGFGDLNRDFISQLIRRTSGPVKMMQFAFSSKVIERALFERAKRDGSRFEFYSVGDTPFALRDWSVVLSMSGLRLRAPTETGPAYQPVVATNPEAGVYRWSDVVDIKTFRTKIQVAPREYGMHRVIVEGEPSPVEVSSKIHHKVLLSGDISILGTSFNFSESALSNQEQLVAIKDPRISEAAEAMFQGLYRRSEASVAAIAEARNASGYSPGGEKTSTDAEAKVIQKQVNTTQSK